MTPLPAGPIGISVLSRSWMPTAAWLNYQISARRCSARGKLWQKPLPSLPSISHSASTDSSQSTNASVLTNASASTDSSQSLPDLSFHIAASSSGKGQDFDPTKNTYEHHAGRPNALGIQGGESRAERRASRPDSGQDAFFAAATSPRLTTFGVADGVGGWSSSRIDPADFSHGICHYMATATLESEDNPWRSKVPEWKDNRWRPRALMEHGYRKINSDPLVRAGGSTACVGVAFQDGTLRMANLGDSGFLHLRLGAVHRRSEPQTHEFNTPYQLSTASPSLLSRAAIFGGMPVLDLPDQADLSTGQLCHGDVLILATDGVWDNLNPQEVLSTVSSQMRSYGAWGATTNSGLVVSDKIARLVRPGGVKRQRKKATLQGVVAAAVTGEAKLASLNDRRESPFAKAMQRNHPEEGWQGGKVDDICVIALVAVNSAAPADSK